MGKYSSGGKGLGNTVDNVTDINFGSSGNIGGAGNTVSGVNFRNQVDNFPDMNSSGFRAKVNEFFE
jgi:hypothetical protein